jgi:hypothetical protein
MSSFKYRTKVTVARLHENGGLWFIKCKPKTIHAYYYHTDNNFCVRKVDLTSSYLVVCANETTQSISTNSWSFTVKVKMLQVASSSSTPISNCYAFTHNVTDGRSIICVSMSKLTFDAE